MAPTLDSILNIAPVIVLSQLFTVTTGNLCRCTGYRPILEGYKTFVQGKCCGGAGKDGQCCLETTANKTVMVCRGMVGQG